MPNKSQTPTKISPRTSDSVQPRSQRNTRSANDELVVVGIGASAGGLEAFQQLLKNLPVDTGKAFVLIQHLDPGHKSALVEILSRATRMPVTEARESMPLEPNHVYVIPPNRYMTVANRKLQLTSRNRMPGAHFPIDLFLQSLAKELGERAIGVILSGTASDGTIGLKAIKSHGGITFVQDEKSAKYSDMPRNAAASGIADIILPPDQIAGELGKIIRFADRHPFREQKSGKPPKEETSLKQILTILRSASGLDLSNYRTSTVERRILRRMSLMKQGNLRDYVAYLRKNSSEVQALYQDIFIHVTNFFREPERYELLKTVVYPRILKHKSPRDHIRIWVPGCSTGEEVYSIAITLLEFLGTNAPNTPVQLFASDIDESVIKRARTEIYPKSIEQDVSPERLRRFFLRLENGYEVNKSVRELCVFAKHDINRDPPFSRLDLISCCNVLIYFTSETQLKVLKAFHHALKPCGYLILGKSESVPVRANLFEPIDKQNKIFIKKEGAYQAMPRSKQISTEVRPEYKKPEKSKHVFDIQKEADRLALAQYAHRGLLIDEKYKILQFRGDVSRFIRPPDGEASLILTKMLAEDLWLPLRVMVERAKTKKTKQKRQITVALDGVLTGISLEVSPIRHPDSSELFFLVSMDQIVGSGEGKVIQRVSKKQTQRIKQAAKNRYVVSLERELADTKEYIRSNVEEHETINAQLNFANEELQSSNEELQSLNEEIETAKEELESGNEELITLNEELRNRNTELVSTNERLNELSEYARAIISTIREPFLVLNSNLIVKTANRAFFRTFQVHATDTENRHLYEIANGQWNIPALRNLLEDVFHKHTDFHDFEIEHDFKDIGYRIMSLNGRRLLQDSGKEELILLAIEDITHRKALDAAMFIKIQEIHHRVKNNLQIILSLIHLQTKSVKDPKILTMFRETENRIASMALIHEKLYISNQPGKIVFTQYISDLAENLFRSFGVNADRITLRIEIKDIYLDLEAAIPCGLIITELLSNSLLHAFGQADSGQIRIDMNLEFKNDDRKLYKLSVSDNGGGLPTEINPERSESLGMKIVTLLTRQIGGTLKVERRNGTAFRIEFPA